MLTSLPRYHPSAVAVFEGPTNNFRASLPQQCPFFSTEQLYKGFYCPYCRNVGIDNFGRGVGQTKSILDLFDMIQKILDYTGTDRAFYEMWDRIIKCWTALDMNLNSGLDF